MQQETNHKEYFDEISEEYDSYYTESKTIMDFEKVRRLQRAISMADISNADSILNVGVGSGELNRALPTTFEGDVLGIDFSRAMLDLARKEDGEFFQGALQELPLKNNCIDCCFCLGVVGYLDRSELNSALSELYRVLAPGEALIFTFGNRQSPFRKLRNTYYYTVLNSIKKLTGVGDPLIHEYKEYHPDRVQSIATELGFAIENRAYLTYSSGVFNTSLNHWAYRRLEETFGDNDRVGRLAMTWMLKLRKPSST